VVAGRTCMHAWTGARTRHMAWAKAQPGPVRCAASKPSPGAASDIRHDPAKPFPFLLLLRCMQLVALHVCIAATFFFLLHHSSMCIFPRPFWIRVASKLARLYCRCRLKKRKNLPLVPQLGSRCHLGSSTFKVIYVGP
jgi:hypothetical protein